MSSKVLLASGIVTSMSTFGYSVMPEKYGGAGKFPPAPLVFGTALAFTGLSLLDGFQPALAGPLSAAIAVTAFTYYGLPILSNYTEAVTADPPPKRKK